MTALRRLARDLVAMFALMPRRYVRAMMLDHLARLGIEPSPALVGWARRCERALRKGRPAPPMPNGVRI